MATGPNAAARFVTGSGPAFPAGAGPAGALDGRGVAPLPGANPTLPKWAQTAARVVTVAIEFALHLSLLGGMTFVAATSIAIYPLSSVVVLPGAFWMVKHGSCLISDVFRKAYQTIESMS